LLGTDYVDICHLHAVQLDAYDHVVDRFYPALVRAREAGKVRFIGLTEAFNPDPRHAMLERALRDDLWDVIMVGFNVLNQSARDRVLARTRASGVGVLDMFAVRLALSRPERLLDVINGLVSDGAITIDQLRDAGGTMEDPLGWVVRDSDADTLVEAAYRFVRHEPGIDVTLTGTGNLEHLLANITAIQMPPLPDDVVARLKRLFSAVDSVSGQ
jgi:aryl-alcohol dehydrogenase-like predicted oxidoreductase